MTKKLWWCPDMDLVSALRALGEENAPTTSGFSSPNGQWRKALIFHLLSACTFCERITHCRWFERRSCDIGYKEFSVQKKHIAIKLQSWISNLLINHLKATCFLINHLKATCSDSVDLNFRFWHLVYRVSSASKCPLLCLIYSHEYENIFAFSAIPQGWNCAGHWNITSWK